MLAAGTNVLPTRMILTCFLFVSVLAGYAAAADNYTLDDCPLGWTRDNHLKLFGDTCYLFQTGHEREYDVAKRECESNFARLVVIKDAQTQDFLYNVFRHELRFNGVVWIGLTDKVREGHYVWEDGSTPVYKNFAPHHGMIVGAVEDCVGMDINSGGQWKDYRCDKFLFVPSEHVFVCEYPVGGIPTTTSTTTTTTSQPTTAA